MFCRNCAKEIDDKAIVCVNCGVPPIAEAKYCDNCGKPTQANQVMCTGCGVMVATNRGQKSKLVAGLLAIFLGGIGAHKFYLGYSKEALIYLGFSIIGGAISGGVLTTIMVIIALIEGVIYLTRTDSDFQREYVNEHKGWF
jgi:TM2 domain-containing membrane protein YozV